MQGEPFGPEWMIGAQSAPRCVSPRFAIDGSGRIPNTAPDSSNRPSGTRAPGSRQAFRCGRGNVWAPRAASSTSAEHDPSRPRRPTRTLCRGWCPVVRCRCGRVERRAGQARTDARSAGGLAGAPPILTSALRPSSETGGPRRICRRDEYSSGRMSRSDSGRRRTFTRVLNKDR